MISSSALALVLAGLLGGTPVWAMADDRPAVVEDGASQATLAQSLSREAVPDWVKMRDVPAATPKRLAGVQDGIVYLLTDFQVRASAQGHDDWYRVAMRVADRSGLESAGQLTESFDPHFETVDVHFVHIIRDGKVIDRTDEVKFRVVAQENDLDDGIVSGTMKAIANLRDVRVGDVVDYALTTHARTTLWPGQVFQYATQRYSEPQALQALRYLWPEGVHPQARMLNSTVAFKESKVGAMTEWEWTAIDPPATKGEDNVPQTAFQWGQIDISTMSQWAQVAQWAAPLYEGDNSLPDDFAAKLDAIGKAFPKPADRVTEVSRYLQDNIRYVGEELGEGSYVPRRPRLVLERGYGDCKDKALLLAVALRRLGIDAVPALVSTRRGFALKQRLPSPMAFDHVIVRVALDGKVTWIDATGTHRGGRGLGIVPADFGYALPVRAGQTDLEPMTGYGEHAGKVSVLEQYAIDEKADVPMSFHVQTVYSGDRADNFRAHVATRGMNRVTQENLDFYRKRYAGLVESKPLDIRDERDANVVTMEENYTLSKADWVKDGLLSKTITRAFMVDDMLPGKQANQRVNPLAIGAYGLRDHTIELLAKDRRLWAPDDIDKTVGEIHFTRKSTRIGDGVRMVYALDTGKVDTVGADKAEEVFALNTLIGDEMGMEFYLDKSPRPSTEAAGVDQAVIEPYKADLARVVELSQKGGDESAITALGIANAILAKLPRPSREAGLVEGMKGALLASLRRSDAALASLRSATAQYEGNPEVFRLWIAFELDKKDAANFNKVLHRTVNVQPGVVKSMAQNWVEYALQTIHKLPPAEREVASQDFCIALTDAQWQMSPRTALGNRMLGCAIDAHSRRGELPAARALLDQGPSAGSLLRLSIDRRHEALWPQVDKMAGDGLRKAMERDLERTSAALKATPDDVKAVRQHLLSLRSMGRYGEAVALAKPLAGDMGKIEVAEEDGFWLVDSYASTLMAMGRAEEAVSAMDRVLTLGMDRYPSLVSMAINRLGMVNAMGRHQAALDAAADIEAHYADKISDYGHMWVWAEQACAYHGLGRGADAKALEDKLAAKPGVNDGAGQKVAMCRGDVQAVAEMIRAQLKDENKRDEALELFVDFKGKDQVTPYQQKLRKVVDTAIQMPQVQAEFRKVGRVVAYAGARSDI